MTAVKLPVGLSGSTLVPKLLEYLINCFHADGYITNRPAIKEFKSGNSGTCRGSATWYVDENAYFVIGPDLIQVDASGNAVSVGSIAGGADVDFSLGQVNLVIVVKGGAAYTYNSGSGVVEITDPDYIPSSSVDFIDGRHVFVPTDGSPAFYSEIDQAGNINPLNSFDAEELPDLNKVTINVSNSLYIGGGESFEIYRSTGDVNFPFQRRDGARIDVGYVSGIERYLSSFMFIGRNRDQSYAIHLMVQGATEKVSNEIVDELLNREYTKTELQDANSFSFKWLGHQFVGWNLARHTIVYTGGGFVFFDSNLDNTIEGPWRGRNVAFAHGFYLVGDNKTTNIGLLDESQSEYGEDIEHEIRSYVRSGKGSYFSLSEMVLDCLTGYGPKSIGLSLSKDGRGFTKYNYKSLREIGEYNKTVKWAGGLGQYESLMAFKLRWTGNVTFSLEGIEVK